MWQTPIYRSKKTVYFQHLQILFAHKLLTGPWKVDLKKWTVQLIYIYKITGCKYWQNNQISTCTVCKNGLKNKYTTVCSDVFCISFHIALPDTFKRCRDKCWLFWFYGSLARGRKAKTQQISRTSGAHLSVCDSRSHWGSGGLLLFVISCERASSNPNTHTNVFSQNNQVYDRMRTMLSTFPLPAYSLWKH